MEEHHLLNRSSSAPTIGVSSSSMNSGISLSTAPPSANVKVCVRFRPMNKREQMDSESTGGMISSTTINGPKVVCGWTVNASDSTVYQNRPGGDFYQFDYVFGEKSKTIEIFDSLVHDVVSQTYNGFNGTVFAYGQTSSGKTYTMSGSGYNQNIGEKGLIHLSSLLLFDLKRKYENSLSLVGDAEDMISVHFVRLSICYLELYKEHLIDLLLDCNNVTGDGRNSNSGMNSAAGASDVSSAANSLSNSNNNEVRLLSNGVDVELFNVNDIPIHTLSDVMRLLSKGDERRKVSETAMNERSSRSHCVLRFKVQISKKSYKIKNSQDKVKINEKISNFQLKSSLLSTSTSSTSDSSTSDSSTLSSLLQSEFKHIINDDNLFASEDQLSYLNLVDLAGSESVHRAQTENETRREGSSINKSLLALSKLISDVAEQSSYKNELIERERRKKDLQIEFVTNTLKKTVPINTAITSNTSTSNIILPILTIDEQRQMDHFVHQNLLPPPNKPSKSIISYRDSKLTMLLKSSIGGNAQTAIICNASPCISNFNETKSTLDFAKRAKKIKNLMKKNIMIKNHEEERLKKEKEEKEKMEKIEREKKLKDEKENKKNEELKKRKMIKIGNTQRLNSRTNNSNNSSNSTSNNTSNNSNSNDDNNNNTDSLNSDNGSSEVRPMTSAREILNKLNLILSKNKQFKERNLSDDEENDTNDSANKKTNDTEKTDTKNNNNNTSSSTIIEDLNDLKTEIQNNNDSSNNSNNNNNVDLSLYVLKSDFDVVKFSLESVETKFCELETNFMNFENFNKNEFFRLNGLIEQMKTDHANSLQSNYASLLQSIEAINSHLQLKNTTNNNNNNTNNTNNANNANNGNTTANSTNNNNDLNTGKDSDVSLYTPKAAGSSKNSNNNNTSNNVFCLLNNHLNNTTTTTNNTTANNNNNSNTNKLTDSGRTSQNGQFIMQSTSKTPVKYTPPYFNYRQTSSCNQVPMPVVSFSLLPSSFSSIYLPWQSNKINALNQILMSRDSRIFQPNNRLFIHGLTSSIEWWLENFDAKLTSKTSSTVLQYPLLVVECRHCGFKAKVKTMNKWLQVNNNTNASSASNSKSSSQVGNDQRTVLSRLDPLLLAGSGLIVKEHVTLALIIVSHLLKMDNRKIQNIPITACPNFDEKLLMNNFEHLGDCLSIILRRCLFDVEEFDVESIRQNFERLEEMQKQDDDDDNMNESDNNSNNNDNDNSNDSSNSSNSTDKSNSSDSAVEEDVSSSSTSSFLLEEENILKTKMAENKLLLNSWWNIVNHANVKETDNSTTTNDNNNRESAVVEEEDDDKPVKRSLNDSNTADNTADNNGDNNGDGNDDNTNDSEPVVKRMKVTPNAFSSHSSFDDNNKENVSNIDEIKFFNRSETQTTNSDSVQMAD